MKKKLFLILFALCFFFTTISPALASPASFRYVIIEVDGTNTNAAVLDEVQVINSSGANVVLGKIPISAYDSVTNGLPDYWNRDTCWDKMRMTDGLTNYGSASSTILLYPAGGANSRARVAFDLGSSETINSINIFTGTDRFPNTVKVYVTNNYSDTQVSSLFDNTNLVLYDRYNPSTSSTTVASKILTGSLLTISAPTGLTVTGSGGSGTLSWLANPSGDNVTSYNIYENGSLVGTSNGISYNFSGLTSGTYQFTVSAVNATGEGLQSSPVSYTVLGAPGQLTVTAGNTQVSLTWTAVIGAASYNVERSTTSGGIYTQIATNVASPNYTDTSVTNGTTYYYVVTTVSADGESAYSNEVSATPQAPLPSSPTNLVATEGTGQVSLTWDAVTNATGYNVNRATTAGGPYTSIAQNVSATTYTDASVVAGATYYYVITALTSGGESANSNEAQATLSAPAGDRLYVLLDINEQAQLSVTDNLTDNTLLTWTSSDPTVATVDANGKVTALKEGMCFINVVNSDNTYTDYIPVKVMKGAANYRLALHLKAGDSKRLWIIDNASSVTWTSMDTSVASIDSTGKVTAVANGLCIVQGELDGKTYLIYVRVNS